MNGSVLGTPIEFGKGVFASAGTSANFFGPGSEAIVRQVALASSQATRTRNELTVGWDKEGRYRTPTGCFDATGPVTVEGIEINLKGQRVAEHLGLVWIEDDELRDLARHLHGRFSPAARPRGPVLAAGAYVLGPALLPAQDPRVPCTHVARAIRVRQNHLGPRSAELLRRGFRARALGGNMAVHAQCD